MTKKDYQQFATLFGKYEALAEGVLSSLPNFLEDFLAILEADNSRFDRDRFKLWIAEVMARERDSETGKRIKVSA